jgi:hypothetical protein
MTPATRACVQYIVSMRMRYCGLTQLFFEFLKFEDLQMVFNVTSPNSDELNKQYIRGQQVIASIDELTKIKEPNEPVIPPLPLPLPRLIEAVEKDDSSTPRQDGIATLMTRKRDLKVRLKDNDWQARYRDWQVL